MPLDCITSILLSSSKMPAKSGNKAESQAAVPTGTSSSVKTASIPTKSTTIPLRDLHILCDLTIAIALSLDLLSTTLNTVVEQSREIMVEILADLDTLRIVHGQLIDKHNVMGTLLSPWFNHGRRNRRDDEAPGVTVGTFKDALQAFTKHTIVLRDDKRWPAAQRSRVEGVCYNIRIVCQQMSILLNELKGSS